jgi:hypothetical protein
MTNDDEMMRLAERTAASLTPGTKSFMLSPMYSAHAHGISAAWFHDTNWWAGRTLAKMGLAVRRRVEPGLFASVPTELGIAVLGILLQERARNKEGSR